jgi:hypothetical protein
MLRQSTGHAVPPWHPWMQPCRRLPMSDRVRIEQAGFGRRQRLAFDRPPRVRQKPELVVREGPDREGLEKHQASAAS